MRKNPVLMRLAALLLLVACTAIAQAQSLAGITPNQGTENTTVAVDIAGTGTTFQIASGIQEAWIELGATTIPITLAVPSSNTAIGGSLAIPCGSPAGSYVLKYRDTDPGTPYDTLTLLSAFDVLPAAAPTFTPQQAFRGDTVVFAISATCAPFAANPGTSTETLLLERAGYLVPADTVFQVSADSLNATFVVPCDFPIGNWTLRYTYADSVQNPTDTIDFAGAFTVDSEFSPLNAQLGESLTVTFSGIGNNFTTGTNILNKAWIQQGANQVVMSNVNISDPNTWTATLDVPISADGGFWELYYCETNTVTLDEDTTKANCDFLICLSNDCDLVWPGDANRDGIANHLDLLNIGQAFGSTGPVRQTQGIAWVAHPAAVWASDFADGTNFKHADCNGDGTVGYTDTLAIAQNYGQLHFKTQQAASGGGPPLWVEIETESDSVGVTDTVRANLRLGTTAQLAPNTYGIAFKIRYPKELFDSSSVYFRSDNSWMGDNGVNKMQLARNFYHDGEYQVAITRIDQLSVTGQGKIAEFGGATADNLSGKDALAEWLTIGLADVVLIDELGSELPYTTLSDSVFVLSTLPGQQSAQRQSLVVMFPNPTTGQLSVLGRNGANVSLVRVYDLLGRPLIVARPQANQTTINLSFLSQGTYFVETTVNGSKSVQKIVLKN